MDKKYRVLLPGDVVDLIVAAVHPVFRFHSHELEGHNHLVVMLRNPEGDNGVLEFVEMPSGNNSV